MEDRVVLCLDSESIEHPELLGLEGESLASQEWLTVFSDAQRARMALRQDAGSGPVWVASSDTMEGINLAAALKRDCGSRSVDLISFGGSGSVVGRCEAAGVGLMHSRAEFARRFEACKRRALAARLLEADEEKRCVDSPSIAELGIEEPQVGSVEWAGGGDGVLPLPTLDRPVATEAAPSRLPRSSRATAADHDGFVLSVVSGSGGVGKSALAACCAVYAHAMGRRTLLVDADTQFGDMEHLTGAGDSLDIADLAAQPDRIERLEVGGELPALVSAPRHLEQSEVVMGRIGEIIEGVRGRFDVVVVNTGSFWSEQHAQIIESSDQTLFVLDQRPSSIQACSRALDLCRRCGIATQSFRFVLNFCSRHALLTSIDVSCALQGAKVDEVRDGGREVGELLGAGLVRDLLFSKNPFSEGVRALCAQVVPGLGDMPVGEASRAGKGRRKLFEGKRKRASCL